MPVRKTKLNVKAQKRIKTFLSKSVSGYLFQKEVGCVCDEYILDTFFFKAQILYLHLLSTYIFIIT